MDLDTLALAFPPRRPAAPPRVLYLSRSWPPGAPPAESVITEICVGSRAAWLKVLGPPGGQVHALLAACLARLGFTCAEEPGAFARTYDSRQALDRDLARVGPVLASLALAVRR